jgi:type VI secretion system VasD/TssJ family lipoprotein
LPQPCQERHARPPLVEPSPVPDRSRRPGAAVGLALALGLAVACGGAKMPKPREVCLQVQASPNLNLYDGQAHAVTVYLYPLISPLGFEQASVQDLLEGATPPGVAGPPVPITVGPGEQREFQEAFPQTAAYMGIVVDYYRAPGDPEGTRRAVVPAACGLFSSQSITLSPQDLLVN